MRYGMLIDLKRCIGCYACAIACKAENGTPPAIHWRRVLWHEEGKYPNARRVPVPVACNHCANPPCVTVCPTGASHTEEGGLVLIEEHKCIGCRYCMMACPYKNRYFLKERRAYFPEHGFTPYEEMGGEARIDWNSKINTVVKCTFCAHRLADGLEPACVVSCPAQARIFGDLNDPDSRASQLALSRRAFRMLDFLGTEPGVIYLKGGETNV